MPTYTFRNKDSGDMHDEFMSISAREEYLNNNPNMEVAIMSSVGFGDSYKMGMKKPDGGFKEVLQKIHERVPGSKLNQTRFL